MKMNEQCLPCLINQVIKTSNICNIDNRQELYKKVFDYLSKIDFNKTNPEIIGETFRLLKIHTNNNDPYKHIRKYYNDLFLNQFHQFDKDIGDSFNKAIKYAIVGNVIDFGPIDNDINDKISVFDKIDNLKMEIDDSHILYNDIINANTLLYLGDNCGEIVLDKLLIKRIKMINPSIDIYFAVRGDNVVNDNIEEDAYYVKMDEYAHIINNGDDSLGTVLQRTSNDFKYIYNNADIVISKGQANYESLSDEKKNIYYLLMIKCDVISHYTGIPKDSLVCFRGKYV